MKVSEQPSISSIEQSIQSSIVAETMSAGGSATPPKTSNSPIIDSVPPVQMGRDLVEDAVKKSKFNVSQILVRGFLCTPFLAYATALSALLVAQGWPTAAAGLLFPVGYIMLAMLGLEMATGSFSVMPMALLAGKIKLPSVIRNWTWTFLANLAGGIFFAWLLWFALTKGGAGEIPPVLTTLAHLAEKKASYSGYGLTGWFAAIGMGVLCNWLVSLGPVFSKASRSVSGKVMLIWLPIATFFALGFEHAVVNMFVFPVGILSGADVTVSQWWLWNQIPVTIGNIIGAVIFNSLLWYRTHSA
ncbi:MULTISPECIES: formate/nitrite transporter family protein [Nitrosomonas]|uniref:Formate/nitrite transporter n=2 Tax=Nitrosomonas communis TaxID=44574 RepID=A0A5D3YFD0_9PROT|nr:MULTISPECIES: formate/nitrite transporter family protein [Nitrosomonas]TYP86385.1 formate/nitrite transporter [Nitrosomonas communis]UVS62682.1 formate/nitrite transporter family protein [Nitrosomonas sp. PLL12]